MAKIKGAGGTSGGILTFFVGLGMTIAGGFLFLNQVRVGSAQGFFFSHYSWGYMNSHGLVLIPLIIGIGFLFFNRKSIIGWVLTGAGALIIFLSIISSLRFYFQPTSLFNLIIILILLVGGIGLVLRSFRSVT